MDMDTDMDLHSPPSPKKRRTSSGTSLADPKGKKVSRACDFCKSRKAKCSGTQPCDKCVQRGRLCLYDAKYTRGRPPTPPSRSITFREGSDGNESGMESTQFLSAPPVESTSVSRASPELGVAEIQGQVFDATSGLTFLHRAWRRLAQNASADVGSSAENQPMTMAGDNPLPETNGQVHLPDPAETRRLISLYFDVCIATYRFLHRPTVESWLASLEENLATNKPVWHGIGRAKAAVVLVVLAIAVAHREKSNSVPEINALDLSDELFGAATKLTDSETGFPRLESAQARLVQVLYLLTTSRFNRSWFVFGTALQLISTLGLHRRVSKRRRGRAVDYIYVQCGLRTFWTAYILDNYLGVVFGRPRHFHDEDIDQELPDRINDDMDNGPSDSSDCHIDALIFHTRIARIIGSISREVYSIRLSEQERVAAAHRLIQQVSEWRDSLPLHLGSIPPSMLIPSYRRQATVLKLAHSHAIMHANRLFLLGGSYENNVNDCIAAAKVVLETVDASAKEGPIFHAFWWTHYVTFNALVVVYVWETQRQNHQSPDREKLLQLAQKCHTHLAEATATNSPSRRYAVILEEFRDAATRAHQSTGILDAPTLVDPNFLDQWDTSDWLDLDSSAFWPHDFTDSLTWPEFA